jgi:hypothetical protein
MLADSILKRNIDRINSRIADAVARSGRASADVKLIAVTKQQPPDVVNALIRLGVTDIAENRVTDALEKATHIIGSPVYHFIGNLQRNKVRRALSLFDCIHAVNSDRLLKKINDDAGELGRVVPLPVLIEVNISGEESKQGMAPADVEPLVEFSRGCPNVRVDGLMTMAPYTDDNGVQRETFAGLRRLAETLRSKTGLPLPELSMGMSGDFEVAIEEGATFVRIGSAFFEA